MSKLVAPERAWIVTDKDGSYVSPTYVTDEGKTRALAAEEGDLVTEFVRAEAYERLRVDAQLSPEEWKRIEQLERHDSSSESWFVPVNHELFATMVTKLRAVAHPPLAASAGSVARQTVGELIDEELEARGGMTPQLADGLAATFGTSPELWLNFALANELAASAGSQNSSPSPGDPTASLKHASETEPAANVGAERSRSGDGAGDPPPGDAPEAQGERPACACGPTRDGKNDHKHICWLSWVKRAQAAEALNVELWAKLEILTNQTRSLYDEMQSERERRTVAQESILRLNANHSKLTDELRAKLAKFEESVGTRCYECGAVWSDDPQLDRLSDAVEAKTAELRAKLAEVENNDHIDAQNHAVREVVRKLNDVLDGKKRPGRFGSAELEALAVRIELVWANESRAVQAEAERDLAQTQLTNAVERLKAREAELGVFDTLLAQSPNETVFSFWYEGYGAPIELWQREETANGGKGQTLAEAARDLLAKRALRSSKPVETVAEEGAAKREGPGRWVKSPGSLGLFGDWTWVPEPELTEFTAPPDVTLGMWCRWTGR